jgi:hypothetical protein
MEQFMRRPVKLYFDIIVAFPAKLEGYLRQV